MDYIVVFFLVVLSGLFSGLTLGMFSLNKTALERKIKLGNAKAKQVYKVRKNGNLLLCTLLLGNVAVNSAMAIFLGSIATGVIAGIISTGLIVVFGEILPQAFFSRHALNIGAKMVWIVQFFEVLLYPIAGSLALLLDKMLGKELPTVWSKKELKEIIRFHEDSPDSSLDDDEERILLGALSFSDKKVEDVMTPITDVFCLNLNDTVDKKLIEQIKQKGFSRIPLLEQQKVKRILLARDLLGLPLDGSIRLHALEGLKTPLFVRQEEKLDNILNEFTAQKNHIAIVNDGKGQFKGVVSLEDIIEEILSIEIVDEKESLIALRALSLKKNIN